MEERNPLLIVLDATWVDYCMGTFKQVNKILELQQHIVVLKAKVLTAAAAEEAEEAAASEQALLSDIEEEIDEEHDK